MWPAGEIVCPNDLRDRLDKVLPALLPGMTRGEARRLISAGAVFVGGRRCRVASRAIEPGARIRIDDTPLEGAPALPILAQGRDWLAVDKPVGLPTAPTQERAGGSVFDLLSEQLRQARRSRPLWVVHRLDADTSGVLLFATTREAASRFSEAFRCGSARKVYGALVRGGPQEDRGSIDLPIGRDGRRARVDPSGRPAVTNWEVVERRGSLALLRLEPQTGRMHQLRVHLAALGCPVLGDRWYGGDRAPRLMLHAAELHLPGVGGAAGLSLKSPLPEPFTSS